MAVPADALTTRQKVKDYLSISGSDYDTVIDNLITYVTSFIKGFCGGRNFLAADYIEYKESIRGRRIIFCNQRPVNSITKVEYRSGTPLAPVWVEYNGNGWLPYLPQGYIKFYSQLPTISQGFRVTYNAGYLIDFANEFDNTKHTLPAEITLVATELVAKEYNTRKAIGIFSESTEGQTINYSSKSRELDDNHKNILASYKLYRIAK